MTLTIIFDNRLDNTSHFRSHLISDKIYCKRILEAAIRLNNYDYCHLSREEKAR